MKLTATALFFSKDIVIKKCERDKLVEDSVDENCKICLAGWRFLEHCFGEVWRDVTSVLKQYA